VTLLVCNRRLYRLFHRRGGMVFSLGAIGLHWLHYLYSSATFAAIAFQAWLFAPRSARYLRPEPAPAVLPVHD
jgi:hypothetical protein